MVGIKQQQVRVSELALGMFVSGLDCPWTQTPFPLQGFYICEAQDIRALQTYCRHVYIDISKGSAPASIDLKPLTASPAKVDSQPSRAACDAQANVSVAPLKLKPSVYTASMPLKKEIHRAQQLYQHIFGSVAQVFEQLERGDSASVESAILETKGLAGEVVDSVLRNPDALTWLARVQERDAHTYSHSLRCAILGILFARQMGMDKKDIDVLALGILLKDIGKARLDRALLRSEQRLEQEQADYEQFVELGVEQLRAAGNVAPRVISLVKTHCERLNGSGFPLQLRGDKIPLLGKIAGIVTFYDEVVNPRNASRPLAPTRAVAQLYELRNAAFQEELVVEFIRAIGLYPTGTLVELSNGKVGVVVEQNFSRRLKPKVMLVLDADKRPLAKHCLFDLAEDERCKQAQIDAGKKTFRELERIDIAQNLQPDAYDVDVADVCDQYLFQTARRGWFARLAAG